MPFYLIFAVLVTALLLSGFFKGCTVPIQGQYPRDVVVAAYMAANKGDYAQVGRYLSYERRNAIKKGKGMQEEWNLITRSGTIEKIDIMKEEQEGEGAKVFFTLHFKDGSKRDDTESLIKQESKGEEERWKLFVR